MTSRIEQLLRKELRQKIDTRKDILLIQTRSIEYRVLKLLLERTFHKRLKIVGVPPSTRRRSNLFRPTSLEHELTEELRSFLENRPRKTKGVPIMETIPENLLLAFAQRHNFSGKPLAKKDDVRKVIEALQKTHPQTKASLRKSFTHLEINKKSPEKKQ